MDVRFGLIDHGPVDFSLDRTKTVKVGVIGSSRTVDGLREWFRRCESIVPAKQSRQPNLFPAFPGSGIGGPFRCWFEIDDQHQRILATSSISDVVREIADETAIKKAVDLFIEEIRDLSQLDRPPHVIVCALPIEIIERVKNLRIAEEEALGSGGTGDSEDADDPENGLYEDFRGALKAASMPMKIPIQLIWPSTYDNSAIIKRKLARLSDRRVQDEATRAWNFFCALYYKAGGTPWRMIRDRKSYDTTYLGISFFQDLSRGSLRTSSAQLFDERGEGLILKGGTALEDKHDRNPYLSRDDAHSLLKRSLGAYKREHANYPARLVIHKSSRFHDDELEGLNAALDEAGVTMADFIWMPRRSPIKLVRQGDYPPLRGTAMRVDQDSSLLYTRGSVDFFATYPGMYVPNPLILRCQRRDRTEWDALLHETMALTKMNWNNTQFDGALPITMRAARQVGEILKYIPDGVEADPRYRFYM
ncbi:PIWI domain-containing protein (plasmid) [Rhizobium sp. NXC24]|nr:PIWI domain-containing protein [Rhizobium sp. NXC24]